MSQRLRAWVLVLVALCLQIPAGASLRVCLCGLGSQTAACACAADSEPSCCAKHAEPQAQEPKSCHGTERCSCHVLKAPERDPTSVTPTTVPAAQPALLPNVSLVLPQVLPQPLARLPVVRLAWEPPGSRRHLPLRI